MTTRPFRSPHHTISGARLLGGTAKPAPGEVSLAHNGVLFLDELPELHRSSLEVMRQPLEDGKVTISRAAGSLTFPSEFMLVAAMNPCPCGHYANLRRECRCSPVQIQKYQNRISGSLLDRIDIHVEVLAIELKDLTESSIEEPSATIRERVTQARFIQRKRFSEQSEVSCNAWSFWYGTRLRAAVRYKRATGAFLLGPTKAGNLAKTIRQHLEGVLA